LAARLAEALGVPHIELDALHHGPNWQEATAEQLHARVEAALAGLDGWVTDGNYMGKLGTWLIDQADTIVWLDLPLRTLLVRRYVLSRRRMRERVELWHPGNVETWRGSGCCRRTTSARTTVGGATGRRVSRPRPSCASGRPPRRTPGSRSRSSADGEIPSSPGLGCSAPLSPLGPLDDHGEGGDDVRIELGAGVGVELLERLLARDRQAVGPRRGHGREGVTDGDDAGCERDRVAGEPVRVARSVPALVR